MRIAIAGISGRMGRCIAHHICQNSALTLAGGWEHPGHQQIGQEIQGVKIVADPHVVLQTADVYIDFTTPQASLQHVEIASALGVGAVIGTTGFTEPVQALVAPFIKTIPIVWSPNMSVGVNLLRKLVNTAATVLKNYDIEMIDIHHNQKVDAPSGTAKALLEEILAAKSDVHDTDVVYGRHGITGVRPQKQIGVHTLRAGDVFGDHTVLFVGAGERLELTHRALSRDPFALGAIRAAQWVKDKPAGLYDMFSVLGW